jgi:hypothetical protein
MSEGALGHDSSDGNLKGQSSVDRKEAELLQKVEEAAVLLIETADSLQGHPTDRMASAARETLVSLTPPPEEAIQVLEDIERHRDLSERELSQRYAFKMLLAAT